MPQETNVKPEKAKELSHVMRVALYNNMKRRKKRQFTPEQ